MDFSESHGIECPPLYYFIRTKKKGMYIGINRGDISDDYGLEH